MALFHKIQSLCVQGGSLIVARFAFLVFFVGIGVQYSHAAEVGHIEAREMAEGFARIIISFEQMPPHSLALSGNILILSFEKPVSVDVAKVTANTKSFISAARLDPDGRAIRFALNRKVKTNLTDAGNRFFLDMMPEPWDKPNPGLPADVVAELSQMIEQAEKKARQKILKETLKRKTPDAKLRIASTPTFTRFAFMWPGYVESVVERKGNAVTVHFQRIADINLDGFKTKLPDTVLDISKDVNEDGLFVTLKLAEGVDVRSFQDGNDRLLDVEHLRVDENVEVEPEQEIEKQAQFDLDTGEILLPSDVTPQIALSDRKETAHSAGASVPKAVVTIVNADEDLNSSDDNKPLAAVDEDAEVLNVELEEGLKTPFDYTIARVEVRQLSSHTKIVFPFAKPTPSSFFKMGNSFYAVFQTDKWLDINSLRTDLTSMFDEIEQKQDGRLHIVRFVFAKPFLATVQMTHNNWNLFIGQSILEPPQSVKIDRDQFADGRYYVKIPLPYTPEVFTFRDSEALEDITVLPLLQPTQALLKRRSFVEFELLPTLHGLAIKSYIDDLDVRQFEDNVIITRDSGLSITTDTVFSIFGASPEEDKVLVRPAFINFSKWKAGGAHSFFDQSALLLSKIIHASDPGDVTNSRLDLARFYISNEMANEAIGILQQTAGDDLSVEKDAGFQVLGGAANVMAHRPDRALVHLSSSFVPDNPDVKIWRGLAYYQKERYRDAQIDLLDTLDILKQYPDHVQADVNVALARCSLMLLDISNAELAVQNIRNLFSRERYWEEERYLSAWLMEITGDQDAALQIYETIISQRLDPIAIEARYRYVDLKLAMGLITSEEATSEFEKLVASWRGDTIELKTLSRLAQTYAKSGRYRDAFSIVRIVNQVNSDSDIARALQDEMVDVYADLFLHDNRDKITAVDAFGIFYSFPELIPVGYKGDAVIRGIAKKLVQNGLYDQAASVLSHQVNERLSGIAKTEVAADLALIHLLNKQPSQAISILRRTRTADIPRDIERLRRILEARALADTGQHGFALELLNGQDGADVERIRAGVYWVQKKWQNASEALENMLSFVALDGELKYQQRSDILRTAMGYYLADDTIALQRIATRFADAMSQTPDAPLFDLLIAQQNVDAFQIRAVSVRLSSEDILDAFLSDVRHMGIGLFKADDQAV